ncbi:MAG: fructose-bisphosphate aldolase [Candidatus Lindowbacteria bacterium RIFCSPLOWO2_12_FULL_62_27]|nr:MAG: fructose-bisphosphate aldolase [Candidatus Lindowbacteria bacterium RIFCSPLOWO2_12_FULL_62_27]
MLLIGKAIRMERIMNRRTGNCVVIPMDHGLTLGPIKGLENMKDTVSKCVEGGADAVLLHKGIVESGYRGGGRDVGLIIHMSASTSLSPTPNYKVMVCTVEEAIRRGADGVSVHINLAADEEPQMLEQLGQVSAQARAWGMPLLAMMYTRGEKVKDAYDPLIVSHAARVAAEMGADIVKVQYTGSVETFRKVVQGCPIPVLIAGGEKMETDTEVLEMMHGAMQAGARGASIGRNVFQHKDPVKMIRAISAIVHDKKSVKEAEKSLRGK